MSVIETKTGVLLTTAEAAKLIGVTTSRVRQLLISGQMQGVKITQNAWLVPESEAKKFASRGKTVGRPRSGGPKVS